MPYVNSVSIYRIENIVNKNCYIGSTVDSKRRWQEHRKKLRKGTHTSFILQAAWDKYGEESFKFQVLFFCPEEVRTFYENRALKIARYNVKTEADAYNSLTRTRISKGSVGKKFSDEHKQHISDAKIGVALSSEHRKKLGEHWRSKVKDPAWVASRSAAIKERYKDPELRERMRQQANRRWGNAV